MPHDSYWNRKWHKNCPAVELLLFYWQNIVVVANCVWNRKHTKSHLARHNSCDFFKPFQGGGYRHKLSGWHALPRSAKAIEAVSKKTYIVTASCTIFPVFVVAASVSRVALNPILHYIGVCWCALRFAGSWFCTCDSFRWRLNAMLSKVYLDLENSEKL